MYKNRYHKKYVYDGNGNILSLKQYDAGGTIVDNLTYHYDAVKENRLLYVSDALVVAATPISLESQASDNYGYDEIGRIIKDKMRGITAADWTLANKPREMTTDRGTVKFRYDAMNEKIYREEYTETPTEKKTVRTWYVCDASGNILSIYSKEDKIEPGTIAGTFITEIGTTELDEQPLYGSNRIGIYEGKTGKYHRTQGHITFELNNHLGNVLATVSDLKRGTTVSGGKLSEYEGVVITQRDYLAFGLEMPDRSYNAATADDHRFSFNGKEDDELIGWQDYGFRWYDKKIRRFVSVDPLSHSFPWYTPYQFAGNTPVQAVDIDGLEPEFVTGGSSRKGTKYTEGIVKKYFKKDPTTKTVHLYPYTLTNNNMVVEVAGLIQVANMPSHLTFEQLSYNCMGYVFANGEGWINDNFAAIVLNYAESKSTKKEDLAKYMKERQQVSNFASNWFSGLFKKHNFKHIKINDIIVYQDNQQNITHVAKYIGNGKYSTKNGNQKLKVMTPGQMSAVYKKNKYVGYISGKNNRDENSNSKSFFSRILEGIVKAIPGIIKKGPDSPPSEEPVLGPLPPNTRFPSPGRRAPGDILPPGTKPGPIPIPEIPLPAPVPKPLPLPSPSGG